MVVCPLSVIKNFILTGKKLVAIIIWKHEDNDICLMLALALVVLVLAQSTFILVVLFLIIGVLHHFKYGNWPCPLLVYGHT